VERRSYAVAADCVTSKY